MIVHAVRCDECGATAAIEFAFSSEGGWVTYVLEPGTPLNPSQKAREEHTCSVSCTRDLIERRVKDRANVTVKVYLDARQ